MFGIKFGESAPSGEVSEAQMHEAYLAAQAKQNEMFEDVGENGAIMTDEHRKSFEAAKRVLELAEAELPKDLN